MKVKKFNEMESINEFHHETQFGEDVYKLILSDIANGGKQFDIINNLTYKVNKYIKDNIDDIYNELKNK